MTEAEANRVSKHLSRHFHQLQCILLRTEWRQRSKTRYTQITCGHASQLYAIWRQRQTKPLLTQVQENDAWQIVIHYTRGYGTQHTATWTEYQHPLDHTSHPYTQIVRDKSWVKVKVQSEVCKFPQLNKKVSTVRIMGYGMVWATGIDKLI
jgi:hypothetical protein